jgi:flagellar biosynthesis protein FliR
MSLADLGDATTYALVFCRVGTCLMLMPGFASPHMPMQARLYLAIALSLSITPILAGSIGPAGPGGTTGGDAILIAAECLAGATIGTLARCFFSALHFAATFIAQLAGYNGQAMVDDGTGEAMPELGALLAATILALVFILDFHVQVIAALIESYAVIPFGVMRDAGEPLDRLVKVAVEGLQLAVRIAGPFIAIAVLINVALGFVNKVAPQIPVYFISAPFLALAALALMYGLSADLAMTFTGRFLHWFARS